MGDLLPTDVGMAGADDLMSTTIRNVEETTTLSLEEKVETLLNNTDSFFLIVIGCIIFLMQCGFAFLEAGSVRYVN